MSELSPATQAVLDAFRSSHTGRGCLAAALRAVAEQGATFYWWDNHPVQAVTVGSLLAIATELEAQ